MSTVDVFLSYNREDTAIARDYADAFVKAGLNVWWDAELRSGEAYDEVTEAALREAKAVVVLWSPRSVVSRWVRAEATIAHRNKSLMPVTIEPCDRPVMFELTQTADLSHWRGAAEDKVWRAFLEDVRRMVGRSEPNTIQAPPATSPVSPPSGGGMPKVAVLPLAFRASDEGMELLAEELTEEITRELVLYPLIEVIAASTMASWRGKVIDSRVLGREVGARFLVEGKLQRAGENVRLTLQLIDAATGGMMWFSRLTRKLADIEVSPEAFPASAAVEISQNLFQIEMGRAMTNPGPFSVWDHVLRIVAYTSHWSSDSMRRSIDEARLAVAAAPNLGLAHALLASALALLATVNGEKLNDAQIREIQAHIARATQLDGNDFLVLTYLSNAYYGLGEFETGLNFARRLMELAPHSTASLVMIGLAAFSLGRTADAIAAFTQRIHMPSFDPGLYHALIHLGICRLLEGQVAEAEAALDQALALHPDYHITLKWKAIVAAQRGAELEALASIKRMREIEPQMSIEQHAWQIERVTHLRDRTAEAVATLVVSPFLIAQSCLFVPISRRLPPSRL